MPDGDEGRHVDRLADGRSPCLDVARPFKLSAIVVERRKAREAGDRAPAERAQLGQVSQERRNGGGADALEAKAPRVMAATRCFAASAIEAASTGRERLRQSV